MASLMLLSDRHRTTLRRLLLDGSHRGEFAVRDLVGVRARQTDTRGAADRSSRRSRTFSPTSSSSTTALVMLSRARPGDRPSLQSVGRRNRDDRRCRHRDGVPDRSRQLSHRRSGRCGPSGRAGTGGAGRAVQRPRVPHGADDRMRSASRARLWLPYLPLLRGCRGRIGTTRWAGWSTDRCSSRWESWWPRCSPDSSSCLSKTSACCLKWRGRLFGTA